MPYSVVDDHEDCDGFAVVKDATNELMGCHKTKAQAEAQLTAINISEYDGKNRKKTNLEIAYDILNKIKKEI